MNQTHFGDFQSLCFLDNQNFIKITDNKCISEMRMLVTLIMSPSARGITLNLALFEITVSLILSHH